MGDMEESIEAGRSERRKFLIKKEFDIISNFGARETKWEQLYDKTNDKYLYIHSETSEVNIYLYVCNYMYICVCVVGIVYVQGCV